MNKKQNNYIRMLLIVFVLIVWGSVFFRVKELREPEVEYNDYGKLGIPEKLNTLTFLKDTLYLNYQDPFLKKARESSMKKGVQKVTQINKSDEVEGYQNVKNENKELLLTEMDQLMLQYYGCVANAESEKNVGFVKINGKLYVVSKGDRVDELLVKEFNSERLIVERGNKKYAIKIISTDNERIIVSQTKNEVLVELN